jgi:hypothetical protein
MSTGAKATVAKAPSEATGKGQNKNTTTAATADVTNTSTTTAEVAPAPNAITTRIAKNRSSSRAFRQCCLQA